MSYIGNQPFTAAFLTDQFSGNGSTVAFTLSAAPANTNSIIVAVSGVLQDPTTYSVSGTTLTFSAAPPAGTGNISVRFLGIPASGVVTTAYRTQTEFTATAGQTTFSVPSYTPGFIDVYRNGVMLGSTNFTATNGTTVVLANAASAGDLVEVISFSVSSVLNAIPATAGAVTDSYILSMAGSKLTGTQVIPKATLPTGSVLQVVQGTYQSSTTTTSTTPVATGLTASITPTSASSKILVSVLGSQQLVQNGTTNIYPLFRNGSSLISTFMIYSNPTPDGVSMSGAYLDSPATTSSTTYDLRFYTENGGYTASFGSTTTAGAYLNTITLMEIAA